MHVSVVIVCSSVRVIVRSFVHASVIISQERKEEEGSKSTRPTEARQGQQLRENRNSPNQDHHVETNKETTIKLATYTLRFIIHGYACIRCHRVFVRSFVRACVSHHITREKEEGSKSRRPTEARQGQQERENRNSPNQDHHVERNKQTTIRLATYRLRFIIHGYACIRCHSSCVR